MIIRERYKDTIMRMTHFMFPDTPLEAGDRALDWSIDKRYKEEQATIVNNYTKRETTENLDALTEYILRRQPILTPYGVMFKRPGSEPVPLLNMIKSFMDLRGVHKSQMFEYEKGTDEYNQIQQMAVTERDPDSTEQAGKTKMYFPAWLSCAFFG